ncbi:MAG: bifunctional 5,10-methylenetetrahydrofolate dehydrogenase/5,10-methenyltetrahydrofolate cyclohydrolase, partial [Actinomycetota bacterium]|nr:bifunctional 5,10-methylenetetrahydrofolate dehydrogenase/5,10-methenyltetrahydrofolate cyclohydrolase [Actinomycetota bacterium]
MTPQVTALRLSGTDVARGIRERVAAAAAAHAAVGRAPQLAVVVATDDEASGWYVRSISRAAGAVGIDCQVRDLGPAASADRIRGELAALSASPEIDGVMLQTPLPDGVDVAAMTDAISPEKDVDGASTVSLGRLTAGRPAFAPATARAVVELLDAHGIGLAGRHVVVIGRSTVVGRPLAQLLLARDATVTICHSRSARLADHTRAADVLVAAAGRPALVAADSVTPGTVVIDVGTNPTPDGGLVGDVDAAS